MKKRRLSNIKNFIALDWGPGGRRISDIKAFDYASCVGVANRYGFNEQLCKAYGN